MEPLGINVQRIRGDSSGGCHKRDKGLMRLVLPVSRQEAGEEAQVSVLQGTHTADRLSGLVHKSRTVEGTEIRETLKGL